MRKLADAALRPPMTRRSLTAGVSLALLLLSAGSHAADSSKAATATSAADFGGMDGLVAAAKEEGALNVIALPPDWANYGVMIKTFAEKYGIKAMLFT